MQVIEKHPIPIYQISCPECKSVLRYKASEVSNLHITCPVCGVSMWAETVIPVNTEDCVNECDYGCPKCKHELTIARNIDWLNCEIYYYPVCVNCGWTTKRVFNSKEEINEWVKTICPVNMNDCEDKVC